MEEETDSLKEGNEIHENFVDDLLDDQYSLDSGKNNDQELGFIENQTNHEETLPTISAKYVILFIILVVGIGVLSTLLAQLLIEKSKASS